MADNFGVSTEDSFVFASYTEDDICWSSQCDDTMSNFRFTFQIKNTIRFCHYLQLTKSDGTEGAARRKKYDVTLPITKNTV